MLILGNENSAKNHKLKSHKQNSPTTKFLCYNKLKVMDNDKQKSAENNASARPGIFSTPDLTVDSEKLAQSAPTADSNKSRIASVFANTDATRQAQQFTITSTPLEGDIVLNNAPKKRSKLPILIVVGVIILLIGAIIVYTVLSNSNSQKTENEAGSITRKFDTFASYILFDGQNDDLSGDYDPSFTYAIENNMNNDEKSNTFWSHATALLNEVMQSDEVSPSDTVMHSLLDGYYQNFQFLDLYRRTPEPSHDKIMSDYANGGIKQSVDYVKGTYNDFNQPDNEVSRAYYDLMIEQAEKDLEILDTYGKHGCISGGDIDTTCEEALLTEPETVAILDQYMSEYTEISNQSSALVKNAITSVISNCWVINSRLHADENMEDGVGERL